MSARIARGSGASRGRSQPKGGGRGGARRRKQPGLIDSLPLEPGAVRRIGLWLLLGFIVAIGLAAMIAMRLPQAAGSAVGNGIGDAGFAVRRVEIRGLERMERLPVYAVALDQESMAMPLVDLAGTRERLLRFGWIKEARVSRRLPDTLVVDVVERRPAAIWQHEQRLSLIDDEGVVLEPVRLEAVPDLPLLIGPGANRQVDALLALVEATPHLQPQVTGATWIGGRRWDLRFQTGEVLALPEGEEEARRAIASFARMDRQTQLLGRGFVRFDMRIPGRFIVRVSREPGSTVPTVAGAGREPGDPGEWQEG
jgi:cell division protein FtsQ